MLHSRRSTLVRLEKQIELSLMQPLTSLHPPNVSVQEVQEGEVGGTEPGADNVNVNDLLNSAVSQA